MRPNKDEAVEYFHGYIDQVPGDDFIGQMASVQVNTQQLLAAIKEDKETYRYAEGKWSIREVIGHLIDTERVFNYRALSFARGDDADLPGFDHDAFVPTSKAHERTLAELAAEYGAVRSATTALFNSFDDDMLKRGGTANGNKASVLALGFIIVGHEIHHMNIIGERYLS